MRSGWIGKISNFWYCFVLIFRTENTLFRSLIVWNKIWWQYCTNLSTDGVSKDNQSGNDDSLNFYIIFTYEGLNQTAENLAGQLTIKMFPIALKAFPMITNANPWLMKSLKVTPIIFRTQFIDTFYDNRKYP